MSWTMRDLLLKGAPWEVLPQDRPRVEAAARKYAEDARLSKLQRDYVRRIWLPAETEAAVSEDQSIESRYLRSVGEDVA